MEQRIQRPRIADVARQAGVSKTAVSFAFNAPSRLAPDTALRIRPVAHDLGYRHCTAAWQGRSTARRSMGWWPSD